MYAKIGKPERRLTEVNTLDHDVKSCQVMRTIGNCSDIRLKILKILTTHKRDVDTVNKYVAHLQYFK